MGRRRQGVFQGRGLDYEFRAAFKGQDLAKAHATPNKVGAFQNIEAARHQRELRLPLDGECRRLEGSRQDVRGRVFGVAGGGVRAARVADPHPADLRGVPISVGHQSGSHYSTIQALEQYLPAADIKLSFADGILFSRLEKLVDRQVPAASLFSGPYYFLEQLGFRKVIDSTFMMAAMLNNDPDPEDVKKYYRALRKAQRDIDLRPELHTHHYRKEFPARFTEQMDTRRWGPGERIVFEPYTKEVFEESFKWIREHHIFDGQEMGAGKYEEACVSLAR